MSFLKNSGGEAYASVCRAVARSAAEKAQSPAGKGKHTVRHTPERRGKTRGGDAARSPCSPEASAEASSPCKERCDVAVMAAAALRALSVAELQRIADALQDAREVSASQLYPRGYWLSKNWLSHLRRYHEARSLFFSNTTPHTRVLQNQTLYKSVSFKTRSRRSCFLFFFSCFA